MKLNFCRVMRHLAMRHGDKEAIVNIERNRRYTFREYHLLTNRIADALRSQLGITAGDKFLLILENDNLSLLHFPMFLKQEGTAVMSNLRDSVEEHRWQVELVKPKVVFIENHLLDSHVEMLQAAGCIVVAMDKMARPIPEVLQFWDMVEAASDADNDVALEQHAHPVLMRFTGSTTGRSKCAIYTADVLFATRDGSLVHPELELAADTRLLHVAPLSHGTQVPMYATFFLGGANLTLNALDLEAWREAVETEAVTHSFLVPTVLYRLLELQQTNPRKLSSLKTLIYGAAPMSAAKLEALLDCFGPIFVQGYASTEAFMLVSVLAKTDHRIDDETSRKRLGSAGRVTPGVEVFVADSNGKELPAGEIGEIRIRCRGIAKGYYENPEQTAAEFVDGAWCSGDIGYLDDGGYLYIVDRLKDMIITGGFNVYAVEVEAALASHPAVMMSAVVGIPHEEWGEAVHAEVILRSGSSATSDDLIEHAKAQLGSYKAPKTISFVSELPMSSVGKVLRRKVREAYWAGKGRNIN
jgi:acyl-CoA synthetase (AMP-forming)/AMP-acid ligase II